MGTSSLLGRAGETGWLFQKAEKAVPSRELFKLPGSKDYICPVHHCLLTPSWCLPLSGNQVLGGTGGKEGERKA